MFHVERISEKILSIKWEGSLNECLNTSCFNEFIRIFKNTGVTGRFRSFERGAKKKTWKKWTMAVIVGFRFLEFDIYLSKWAILFSQKKVVLTWTLLYSLYNLSWTSMYKNYSFSRCKTFLNRDGRGGGVIVTIKKAIHAHHKERN